MTTVLTTTATRTHYTDAINDAITEAEKILGSIIVTHIECDAVTVPSWSNPAHVTGYEATVECTKRNPR